ncbi:MAG: hypothetical protein H0U87_03455 [Acidobacteria bacterium]|jgi:hypothetical protein|nr:hypothetical protein [Acidobacteriota bacterium]
MKTKNIGKSYVKPFLIGTAIFTVLILHFAVSQFIALDGEKDESVSELINKQPVIIEPEIESEPIESEPAESVSETKIVSPFERREQKTEPARAIEKDAINRKKAARESRTERLRRAEKILTGI